jgi:hypothetical protein
MAKARATSTIGKARRPARTEALGPGLHAVTLELRSGSSFQIRTLGGASIRAVLADGVERELALDCLRTGAPMIAADSERGPLLLGALMTSRPAARREDGSLVLEAKRIRLSAEQAVSIEAGQVSLRLDEAGPVRFEGDRMVIDMAALVRVLSAKVELP